MYTICSHINNAIDEDFSRVSHWLKGLRELRTHGKLMGPDLCPTVALTCFTTFFCRKRGKNRKKAAGEAHINFFTVGNSKEKCLRGDISMRKKFQGGLDSQLDLVLSTF